jgi:DNA (cytosine-5)-methyltransferase 1
VLIGLSLFSGIGGIDIALREYVRPALYVEQDKFAQGVLLSQMETGELPYAPIWDDVRSLLRSFFPIPIDVIYGGFPCQDISCAGLGKGLEGERSGLVFEVFRLVSEFKPTFVFLENVPAVRSRGAERISKELARRGYDLRWGSLSAAEVGAPHRRNRWFLLAYAGSEGQRGIGTAHHDDRPKPFRDDVDGLRSDVPDAQREPLRDFEQREPEGRPDGVCDEGEAFALDAGRWTTEPELCRVDDGSPDVAHRLRALGNAVVPLQAKVAFEKLVGIRR